MARRVIVLGAGASKADTAKARIPMPLAREFFTHGYLRKGWPSNWSKSFPSFKDSKLRLILDGYFSAGVKSGGRRGGTPFEGAHVEQVFSFLDFLRRMGVHHPLEEPMLSSAAYELSFYIRYVINSAMHAKQARPLHDWIASTLDAGDTIISFNWDTLIEQALAKTEQGRRCLASLENVLAPSVGTQAPMEDERVTTLLLKLHGSVDWARCRDPECEGANAPVRLRGFDLEIPPEWKSCVYCGVSLMTGILPPNVSKVYSGERLWRRQAQLALGALARATEVLVIGYSFPAFDNDALTLLRLARLDPLERGESECYLENVWIVDPAVRTREYRQRVEDILGTRHAERAYGHPVRVRWCKSTIDLMTRYSLSGWERVLRRRDKDDS